MVGLDDLFEEVRPLVDDLADACVFLMERGDDAPALINIGTGTDLSIAELVDLPISS